MDINSYPGKNNSLKNIKGEKWVDLKGFEGYKISTKGRIKNSPNRYNGHKTSIIRQDYCRQYFYVGITKDKKQKRYRVNRLMGITFIDNPDNLPIVMHKDDDKLNNEITNLKWGTLSQNAKDALTNGLIKPKKGEEASWAKLNEKQVLEIFNSNETNDKLGKKYGIAQQSVGCIKQGLSWSHVTNKKYEQKYRQLLPHQIIEIFTKTGSQESIAKQYNISQTQVSHIKTRKNWKHITQSY